MSKESDSINPNYRIVMMVWLYGKALLAFHWSPLDLHLLDLYLTVIKCHVVLAAE